MKYKIISSLFLTAFITASVLGQQKTGPEATEYYSPIPKLVTPGSANYGAPSDAIILFDGKNMDEWELTKPSTRDEKWILSGDAMMVNKMAGDLQTKRTFTDFQLHIEYLIPTNITGRTGPWKQRYFFGGLTLGCRRI